MTVVVADTSPINYLVLLDCASVLQTLYQKVVIPAEVLDELTATGAPEKVRAWANHLPPWVEVRNVGALGDRRLQSNRRELDAGEYAAIQIALSAKDSLLLIDEAAGRAVASELGVANTGTLGVLVDASRAGILDLTDALERLRRTNFRISQRVIDHLRDRT